MSLIAFLALSLSVWQISRAIEKKDLIEKSKSRSKKALKLNIDNLPKGSINTEYWDQQRILISGYWVPNSTVYLDNRSFQSIPGVHVISAFKLDDNKSVVWINRGWAPKPPGKIFNISEFIEGKLYLPINNDDISNIEGIAYTDLMKRIELTSDSSILQNGALWQNLDWNKLQSKLKEDSELYFEKIWPFILWQTTNLSDDLKRSLPIVKVDVNKHIGYAIQWILLCIVSLFFAWRIGRN